MEETTIEKLSGAVCQIHGIRSALLTLADWQSNEDAHGAAYLLQNLADTLERQIDKLEFVEQTLKQEGQA